MRLSLFLLGLVSCLASDQVRVNFVNACYGAVNLYWLHHSGKSEEYITTIPVEHQAGQITHVGNVFRVKWADESNRGIFGEDIIEEYRIEDLGGIDQEIKICIVGRIEEEKRLRELQK